MIDLQYVVLCVSSFVILFHRGRKSGRRKNGKVKGKSKEKHRIKGAEKGGHTRMASPRVRKTAGTPRNRQGENRIMQSCERAVFSPRFLLLLHRTGWEFTCGWCWQHNPLGHQVSAKYRRRIVSWFCPMRRRSLRLLSPGTFLQLGRRYRNVFSGEKLPKGIFCPKTAGLNVEGIVPPSYLLKGTWQVKRGLWWIFIEKYGKMYL